MDELMPVPVARDAQDAREPANLAGRQGFDEQFLGTALPIPELPGVDTILLPYTHFSVLLRPDKRLAAVTALGIDGEKLLELDRSGINWRLDPRVPADQQTGEAVYARNDIDRGHLVRRASAVWGSSEAEAAQANRDTFYYTNSAPQAADFNQGMELWLGLESYLLDHATDYRRRLVVFTGTIFSDKDPVYRGVQIPLRFFKVAAFIQDGALAATAYIVDQTPQLAELPDVPKPGAREEAPPLGPFRTFQVPVRDVAALTGLDLAHLEAADRMPAASALPTARVATTWRLLSAPEDLDLDFDLER
ncbi:DNA/RNA non-specific endonuclease [Pseudarthrobacter sp. J75]|uniref:DNA/RNA non-specific endonuclease n=1 Tax=unclassified Pseudarthrobacter TaxID=2647000 RepID=UPI002E807718|nr:MULTISPECIES: DNA/RNA non-specific endonuclease [unclassified Pseudarthrobacter]MEE2524145.1 DNA/RNA non-specific endonuclease [Pseudarthrobacter sp. J47]MEE2530424.1 DNA/RNA non-specific endonuclease [Pseudarthrobacter sp. J75]